MDIRQPLVDRANGWSQTLGMDRNVRYLTVSRARSFGMSKATCMRPWNVTPEALVCMADACRFLLS